MPNRDYVARGAKKNKKGTNRSLILALLLLLLMVSALGLWVLKENAPVQAIPTQTVAPSQPKSTLPSPPEEVYSYIRDLETREVPVDKNSKLAKLTKEQEQQIQRQKEEEQRKLQQQAQAQTQSQSNETTPNAQTKAPEGETNAALAEEFSLKRAKEKQQAEEKRQAELKKQQDAAQKAADQTAKSASAKAAEQPKPKQEPAKVVASVAKPADVPKSAGKYGLQCGAFKNKAQAENMQARLAMAGYNARINSNGEWNRVVVGPIGNRAAASAAQSNARSVAECLIVGM